LDPTGAYGCTEAFRAVAEAGDGLTSILAYFPFPVGNGAAAGHFVPVLILSTQALCTVTIAAVFDVAVLEGAPVFGRTPAPTATLVFSVYFA
jgi:hypothetical protein